MNNISWGKISKFANKDSGIRELYWIDYEVRKPPSSGEYLCTTEDGVELLVYDEFFPKKVIAWMKKPLKFIKYE